MHKCTFARSNTNWLLQGWWQCAYLTSTQTAFYLQLPKWRVSRKRSSVRQWRTSKAHRKTGENSSRYGIEICSDKSKILVNSIKPMPPKNIWMNGKALEEADQFKYLTSTQTKDGTSVKEGKIRLAQAHVMTRLAILWKTKPSVFPQRLNSTNYLYCHYWDADCRTGKDESKPLKTNARGGCLVYHAENIKQMNLYGNRSTSPPDVRSSYCQLSSVTSYLGSVMLLLLRFDLLLSVDICSVTSCS